MGLLSVGTPLPWADAKQFADHVRTHGINQFLATYKRNRATGRLGILFWGDEVEYMLVRFDPQGNNVTLSLRGYDVLTELMKEEHEAIEHGHSVDLLWRPEYARYMLEGTPGSPYGLKANELSQVQASMRRRREAAAVLLGDNEFLASITCFPRLGDAKVAPFLHPHVDISDPSEREAHTTSSKSLFIPDDAINPHPRFRTLTANIRHRRGEKVSMNMPMFKDKHTPWPFKEDGLEAEYASGHAKENHIYMDCMCFGMGCSCLQLTLQASHMCEARHLYDQLAVLAPIMLSLTASSPIFRGYLADVDCRWNVIAGAVDCRTREERGQAPLEPQVLDMWDEATDSTHKVQRTPRRIPKSRYDSISTYLSQHASFRDEYNDIPLPIDEKIEARLQSEGVDPQLARHIAHLFIRDPLVIYRELLHQDDTTVTDHFENLQSTNWQTMRFKPPPTTHPELGWRVEFRAMEVQPSDFENAAFSVFVVLISRVILCLDLDLYIPLSLVDANMQAAHKRDSVLTGKFWFRNNVPCVEAAVEKLETAQDCQPGCPSSSVSVASDDGLGSPPSTPGLNSSFGHHHESSTDCCGCSSFAPRSRSNSPLRKLLGGLSTSTSPTGSPPSTSPTSMPQRVGSDVTNGLSALGLGMPPASNAATNGTSPSPSPSPSPSLSSAASSSSKPKSPEWTQTSIDEIMNGSATHTGLIPLARAFLDTLVMDDKVRTLVNTYMDLIADRAAGRVATSANWMRQFVMRHPEYKHDSRVSPQVAHDLLREVEKWTKLDAYPKVAPVLF